MLYVNKPRQCGKTAAFAAPRYTRTMHLDAMLHRWRMEAIMAGATGQISEARALALLARIEAQTARLALMGGAAR